MFGQILVGVDDHRGGLDAIALARALAGPAAQLALARVYLEGENGAPTIDDTDVRRHALDVLERASARAGIEAELRCTGASTVSLGLHALAHTRRADLLVVGSSRGATEGSALLGEDVREILARPPCAVAIAPLGYADEPGEMTEIGVGYDESAESRHALEVARELAAARRAKLSAFEAVALPHFLYSAERSVDETFSQYLGEARARIAALGDVEPHAVYGDSIEELVLYSASIDLLVVGSRDYGVLGRLVHESTSKRLAHEVHCPLLVLTRAARTERLPSPQRPEPNTAARGR